MQTKAELNNAEFINKISDLHTIDASEIEKSEFIENLIFQHAKLLDPNILKGMVFPINDNAQFTIDKKGYCVVAYKQLFGVKKHEEIAYIFNKHYKDIDAHVVPVMGLFSSQNPDSGKQGYFYAIRFKTDVLLEKVLIKNPTIPQLVGFEAKNLRNKSKLVTTDEYRSYRTPVENESLVNEITVEKITNNSAISKIQADYLLKKYTSSLNLVSNLVIDWEGDTRCSRADKKFIAILLQVLKAISNQDEKIIYKEYDLGGMSGLEVSEIHNKSPHEVLNYLLQFNPYFTFKHHFLSMSEHYLSTKPALKYIAESFYFDILNPAEIILKSQLDDLSIHNNYSPVVHSESEEDEDDSDYENHIYSYSDSEANDELSDHDSSFFWQFVRFIDDNKRLIAGVLLGFLLLGGFAALTVGTCGLGLLGASAAAAVGVIGIAGTTAIATTAVGGGVALASAAGLACLGFFSDLEKKTEEPSFQYYPTSR